MDFYIRFVACVAVLFAAFLVAILGATPTERESGPCMIRRDRLPRLEPVRVGYVRQMALVPGENPYTVTSLSVRPPIFEIHNFLNESETIQLLQLAEDEELENSDVFHHSLDMMSDTVFEQWDLNSDDVITFDEVISGTRYIRDLHLTESDVQKMFNTLTIGKVTKGVIHRSEFQPQDIMTYIEKLKTADSRVKGRHSNHTFIDGPGYEQLAVTLDVKKAALTGLPIEIIKGSETPSAVKYAPGGHYHCHYDSHESHVGATCCDRNSLHECRICRYITILYYLNDVEDGGQTAFPVADKEHFSQEAWPKQTNNFSNLSVYCSKANLRVTPKRGTAIMWYNHVIDDTTGWPASLDLMSYHGGCDVKRGHKWIVNNWINVIGQDWDDLRTWNDKNRQVGSFEGDIKDKEKGKMESNF